MAISTVARVKTLLLIPSATTTHDALLTQLLAGVESAVASWCKRTFESTTYTQFLDGTGSPKLLLPQYPVSSVTSVRLDTAGYYGQVTDSFGSSTLLTAGVDYILAVDDSAGSKAGVLLRIGGMEWPYGSMPSGTLTAGRYPLGWPAVAGCVKVVYVAGYSTMPEDLKLAVDQITARVFREGRFGGSFPLASERLEDYARTFATGLIESMPAVGSPRQILATYRRDPVLF